MKDSQYQISVIIAELLLVTLIFLFPLQDTWALTILLFNLALLTIITYYPPFERIRWILICGYLARASFALTHAYVTPLPDTHMDAVTFLKIGSYIAYLAEQGWGLKVYLGAHFYSTIIGFLYHTFTKSPLFIQSINVVLGTLFILIVYKIANKLFDRRSAVLSAIIVAFYPTMLLYSSITLREIWIYIFFGLSIYCIAQYHIERKISYFLLSLLNLAITSIFHAAFIALFTLFVYLFIFDKLGQIIGRKVSWIMALLIILGVLLYVQTGNVEFEVAGVSIRASKLLDPEFWNWFRSYLSRGRAAYLQGLKFDSLVDMILNIPLLCLYFLYSPFPWIISQTKDIYGAIDGAVFLFLTITSIFGLRKLWLKNKELAVVLALTLILLIVIFGLGVSNYGAAIRHRAKFFFLFTALSSNILVRKITGTEIDVKN
jgi:hypothetical protein